MSEVGIKNGRSESDHEGQIGSEQRDTARLRCSAPAAIR